MRPRDESKTIAFRLNAKTITDLDRQAKAHGVSPGEYSRAVLERHLKGDHAHAIMEALDALKHRQDAGLTGLERALTALREELSQVRRQEFLSRKLEEALSRLQHELTALREDFRHALEEEAR